MNQPTLLPPGGLLIGERLITDASGGVIKHVNPTTGKPQADLALAGEQEVDQAVAAARSGYRAWWAMSAPARRDALHRLIVLVEEHSDELTRIGALESGVPVAGGTGLALEWMRYYAGWADKLDGETVPIQGGLDYVLPEPYGVIGVIIPWNSPLTACAMTVIPALAAGNAVVLKPPELAPFAAIRLGQLALRAGLPAGTLTVIPGDGRAGDALVRHPEVAKVSFTGGGSTAQKVIEATAPMTKPLMLELGGKSANIVFSDANLDAAVPLAAQQAFSLTGQGCCLPTRLIVHDDVYDEVIRRLVQVTEQLQVGDPLEATTAIGPVINAGACERILGVIDRAATQREGTIVAGGKRMGGALADGYFIQPTVFGDVLPDSELSQKEVFGPVLAVSRFRTEEQAIDIANGTAFGLAAYVHTNDLGRAHRLASRLEAGNVSVNGFYGMTPNAPFGGYKASGFGRTGGRVGLTEFLQQKNVYINLSE
ncbi:aldehyde dehydrogenase [Streptomyces sp. KL116D]|uniref:aldehyde dehydrogenase family protein n=1 Tax=Streptomyces sp. KL116D TaxID=3045152 RepID=UPI003555DCA9